MKSKPLSIKGIAIFCFGLMFLALSLVPLFNDQYSFLLFAVIVPVFYLFFKIVKGSVGLDALVLIPAFSLLFISISGFIGTHQAEKVIAEKTSIKHVQQKLFIKKINDFRVNRSRIVDDVERMTSQGDHQESLNYAIKYSKVNDVELNGLKNTVRQRIFERKRSSRSTPVVEKMITYKQLNAKDPRPSYRDKIELISAAIEQRQRMIAREVAVSKNIYKEIAALERKRMAWER